jgi:hypothetical protein
MVDFFRYHLTLAWQSLRTNDNNCDASHQYLDVETVNFGDTVGVISVFSAPSVNIKYKSL